MNDDRREFLADQGPARDDHRRRAHYGSGIDEIELRKARRGDVYWRLQQMGERSVYRALFAYQRVHRKHHPNWAAAAFREIFGKPPPPGDCLTVPLPDFYIVEEWIAYKDIGR